MAVIKYLNALVRVWKHGSGLLLSPTIAYFTIRTQLDTYFKFIAKTLCGQSPQPSLVCRLALLTYLPVVYRCSINERRPPVSSVVRNIIKLAYFILLAPEWFII